MKPFRTLLLVTFSLSLLAACTQVRPWERGLLAREEMAWRTNALEGALNDHIFLAKKHHLAVAMPLVAAAAATKR